MALLSLCLWLGRDLKLENVSKRQAAAEFIVERLDQFVHDNMGWHFDKFIRWWVLSSHSASAATLSVWWACGAPRQT